MTRLLLRPPDHSPKRYTRASGLKISVLVDFALPKYNLFDFLEPHREV